MDVFKHPNQPLLYKISKFGRDHWKPVIAIRHFYTHKIAHLLEPEAIPNIHLACTLGQVVLVERVIYKTKLTWKDMDKQKPDTLVQLLMRLDAIACQPHDTNPDNYVIDIKNRLWYIDDLEVADQLGGSYSLDQQRIKLFEAEIYARLEAEDRERALIFLERLKLTYGTLFDENSADTPGAST
ncbi:MAG: hypothetical protein ACMG6E_08595 [Candidatus Roizmanbacteria bacterium]